MIAQILEKSIRRYEKSFVPNLNKRKKRQGFVGIFGAFFI